MDDTKSKIPPPVQITTNDGVGIHLSYIRRDIDEIKGTLSDLKNAYVTRIDFDEHLKQDNDHENRIRELRVDLVATNKMIDKISTTFKTWGSVGVATLVLLQIIQILYFFNHLPK